MINTLELLNIDSTSEIRAMIGQPKDAAERLILSMMEGEQRALESHRNALQDPRIASDILLTSIYESRFNGSLSTIKAYAFSIIVYREQAADRAATPRESRNS